MQVNFTEQAFLELNETIEYYNHNSPNLGSIFFDEIYDVVSLISLFPEMWAPYTKNTRKAVLKRFPYNVVYSIYKDKIYIIAIAHQHREPGYWLGRP